MGLPGDIDAWIDKLAINELVAQYSDAVTRGDWDAFEAVWAPDGVWQETPPIETEVVGARAIREQVAASLDAADLYVQMVHEVVITVLGDGRASARTHLQGIAKHGDHDFVNYGIYYDELVKIDGIWKFTRRRLQHIYVETSPLVGQVAISRSALP